MSYSAQGNMFTGLPTVVKNLLIINVLVFLFTWVNRQAHIIGDVETLFGFSPHWEGLSVDQRAIVMVALAARIARDRQGDVLPIPSTALIARGTKR